MKEKYQWVRPTHLASKEVVSTREAAKMLKVSLSTVQRYVDNGTLGGETNPITGRRDVYKESVLDMMKAFGL